MKGRTRLKPCTRPGPRGQSCMPTWGSRRATKATTLGRLLLSAHTLLRVSPLTLSGESWFPLPSRMSELNISEVKKRVPCCPGKTQADSSSSEREVQSLSTVHWQRPPDTSREPEPLSQPCPSSSPCSAPQGSRVMARAPKGSPLSPTPAALQGQPTSLSQPKRG